MANRIAIAVFFACSLFAAQISGAAERNKIIFLSDMHMNVDANYSWLVDDAAMIWPISSLWSNTETTWRNWSFWGTWWTTGSHLSKTAQDLC